MSRTYNVEPGRNKNTYDAPYYFENVSDAEFMPDAHNFFLQINHFLTAKNVSQQDIDLFHKWLVESDRLINEDGWFVKYCLVEWLSKLTTLTRAHKPFEESLHVYFTKNEKKHVLKGGLDTPLTRDQQRAIHKGKLKEKILRHLHNQFSTFLKIDDFTYILHYLSYLKISPSHKWIEDWCYYSERQLNQTSALGAYSVIKSYAMLYKRPVGQSWLNKWFEITDSYLMEMPLIHLIETFRNLQTLQIDIDEKWLKTWLNVVTVLLENYEAEQRHLAEKEMHDLFVNVFKLTNHQKIWNNKRFLHASFNAILSAIIERYHDLKLCKRFFFEVVQFKKENLNITIPTSWIFSVVMKITVQFDVLSSFDIAQILYSLALLHVDVVYVEPFLKKAKDFYQNEGNAFNGEKGSAVAEFRQAIMAQNFFKTKGFDLCLLLTKYPHIVRDLSEEKKKTSSMQHEVFSFLKKYYAGEMHSEYYISCICDKVDLFIPELKLVVESDGSYHLVDGVVDQCTELKNYLLQQNGFNVVRLDYRHFYRQYKEDYIKNELKSYIDFGGLVNTQVCYSRGRGRDKYSNTTLYDLDYSLKFMFSSDAYKNQPATDVYMAWLPEIHHALDASDARLFMNILNQFSVLVTEHAHLKQAVRMYANERADFFKIIRNKSADHVKHYSTSECFDLMYAFSCLEVDIDQAWISVLCEATKERINSFDVEGLKNAYLAFANLNIVPSSTWNAAWGNRFKELLDSVPCDVAWKLFLFCGKYKINLSVECVEHFKARMLSFFPIMDTRILFSLPKTFNIKVISADKKFMNQWFDQSKNKFDKAECRFLVRALYCIAKFDVQPTYSWILACAQSIEKNLNSLNVKDVIVLLQALSKLNVNISVIKSLLDDSQAYFYKRNGFIEQSLEKEDLAKILKVASSLKDVHGYSFLINRDNVQN